MTKRKDAWDEKLQRHTGGIKESEVRQIAKELFIVLQDAQTSNLQAVRKKFSLPKYSEVAKIKVEPASSRTSERSRNERSEKETEGKENMPPQ